MLREATHLNLRAISPCIAGKKASQNVDSFARLFAISKKQKQFLPKEEIFREGAQANYVYRVVHGSVRSYKSLGNGCRKIEAFRLQGDVFGLELGEEHCFAAEAIDHVCLLMARRGSFSNADQKRDQMLWPIITKELERVQKHSLLLAMSAGQRLASFLLEMSQRLGTSRVLKLPMSRQDIADYLGLTIETVSRKLTEFETKGLIMRPTMQQIILVNPIALQEVAGIAEICQCACE